MAKVALTCPWENNGRRVIDAKWKRRVTMTRMFPASPGHKVAHSWVRRSVIPSAFLLLACLGIVRSSSAAIQSAEALVLVNSASARFLEFRNYLQPYLDHFGIP